MGRVGWFLSHHSNGSPQQNQAKVRKKEFGFIGIPHRNAMPQTQGTTPHPVTVYRHGDDLSLCYPLMWNATLEYTATHFNVFGKTRLKNPSPTFHTPANAQLYVLVWW